ncbi:replication-associated protein [Dragonfly larvae associated circular virus-5]|uniref:replication-associated protein n=1 Tax=Dragonfly larvae associated circular virus-5 TaxID=1454026 RepID=UPI0003E81B70|nr:replication-associated protein [Dragonfly larvae associated circular virus-5]AHH31471.1 replication-associated protein [Dragonfly larvae associated circular virus-5]AHH31472.1 replication-associated protein [Dragonfly larvae associated circular virus-5]
MADLLPAQQKKIAPTQKWKDQRGRCWCFTAFVDRPWKDIACKYIVVGHEICPKTGKEHWQGYVEFGTQRRPTGVQKTLGIPDLHVEKRLDTSTPDHAANYCKKDMKFVEYGKISKQGERMDLDLICHDLQTGKRTWREIMGSDDVQTVCKYRMGLQMVAAESAAERAKKPREVTWERKPSMAAAWLDYPDALMVNLNNGACWEAYGGEEEIIVRHAKSYHRELLLDGWITPLNVKCTTKYAAWTKVICVECDPEFFPPVEPVSEVVSEVPPPLGNTIPGVEVPAVKDEEASALP